MTWFVWLQIALNIGFWSSMIALSMLARNQQKQINANTKRIDLLTQVLEEKWR